MAKRQVSEAEVKRVLADPLEVVDVRPGRVVAHGMHIAGSPRRSYLLRVFVDTDRHPPQVVTVFRTSKIEKFRS